MRGSILATSLTKSVASSSSSRPSTKSSITVKNRPQKTECKHIARAITCRAFKCCCRLDELQSFECGFGKNKKQAKSESAKKTIEMIAHIPDVQSVIISIMMSSNLNETFLGSSERKANFLFGQANNRVFNVNSYRTDFPSMTRPDD